MGGHTTEVQIQFPTDHPVGTFTVAPVPGWTINVKTGSDCQCTGTLATKVFSVKSPTRANTVTVQFPAKGMVAESFT